MSNADLSDKLRIVFGLGARLTAVGLIGGLVIMDTFFPQYEDVMIALGFLILTVGLFAVGAYGNQLRFRLRNDPPN